MAIVALHFGYLVCHGRDVGFGIAQFGFMLASERLELIDYYLLLLYDSFTLVQCPRPPCRGLAGARGLARLRYHARALTCSVNRATSARYVSIVAYAAAVAATAVATAAAAAVCRCAAGARP